MNERPTSIAVISWIFMAVGSIALLYHLLPQHINELNAPHSFGYDLAWVCLVRIVAVLCGVFMLRGCNWARWLLVVWVGYHVILSAFHSPFEVVVHGVLFAVVVYFLFRPAASAYFRRQRAATNSKDR